MNPILVMVIRLVVSIVLLIPLMYVSMGAVMWDWPLPTSFKNDPMAIAIYEMVLSLVIMVVNGKFLSAEQRVYSTAHPIWTPSYPWAVQYPSYTVSR